MTRCTPKVQTFHTMAKPDHEGKFKQTTPPLWTALRSTNVRARGGQASPQ